MNMRYLSGSTGDMGTARRLAAAGIGLMIQPRSYLHHRIELFPFWAADIGMTYSADADGYLEFLDRLPRTGLFCVSPDAYPDAYESQRRGLEYAGLIREMGHRPAVVAQNGAENLVWPWEEFDCLFLGGTKQDDPKREWKVSAPAERLALEARNHGLQVHMGRCQPGRLLRARQMGCTSADGTFIRFGPDVNAPRLIHALERTAATVPLPIFERFESLPHE